MTKAHSNIVYRNVRPTQNVMESQMNIPFFCPYRSRTGSIKWYYTRGRNLYLNKSIYLLTEITELIQAPDLRVGESASAIPIAGRSSYFYLPSMRLQLKTRYNYADVSFGTSVRQCSAKVKGYYKLSK